MIFNSEYCAIYHTEYIITVFSPVTASLGVIVLSGMVRLSSNDPYFVNILKMI